MHSGKAYLQCSQYRHHEGDDRSVSPSESWALSSIRSFSSSPPPSRCTATARSPFPRVGLLHHISEDLLAVIVAYLDLNGIQSAELSCRALKHAIDGTSAWRTLAYRNATQLDWEIPPSFIHALPWKLTLLRYVQQFKLTKRLRSEISGLLTLRCNVNSMIQRGGVGREFMLDGVRWKLSLLPTTARGVEEAYIGLSLGEASLCENVSAFFTVAVLGSKFAVAGLFASRKCSRVLYKVQTGVGNDASLFASSRYSQVERKDLVIELDVTMLPSDVLSGFKITQFIRNERLCFVLPSAMLIHMCGANIRRNTNVEGFETADLTESLTLTSVLKRLSTTDSTASLLVKTSAPGVMFYYIKFCLFSADGLCHKKVSLSRVSGGGAVGSCRFSLDALKHEDTTVRLEVKSFHDRHRCLGYALEDTFSDVACTSTPTSSYQYEMLCSCLKSARSLMTASDVEACPWLSRSALSSVLQVFSSAYTTPRMRCLASDILWATSETRWGVPLSMSLVKAKKIISTSVSHLEQLYVSGKGDAEERERLDWTTHRESAANRAIYVRKLYASLTGLMSNLALDRDVAVYMAHNSRFMSAVLSCVEESGYEGLHSMPDVQFNVFMLLAMINVHVVHSRGAIAAGSGSSWVAFCTRPLAAKLNIRISLSDIASYCIPFLISGDLLCIQFAQWLINELYHNSIWDAHDSCCI